MNLIAEFDIVNNREIAPEEFDNKQKAELSCPYVRQIDAPKFILIR
jgi:hypothetical protein